MPDYAVSTAFRAKDHVSGVYDTMGKNAERFQSRTSSAFRNATKEGYKFGTIVKGILAANFLRGGIGLIGSGIQSVSKNFLDFDNTMVGAAVRFDDIGIKSKNFGASLAEIKQKAIEMRRGTRYTVNEVSQGINTLAESGWKVNDTFGVMPQILNAATVAGEDFKNVTSETLNIYNAVGLKTDSAAKNIQNMTMLTDMLTQASLDANGGWNDITEALQGSAGIFVQAGERLSDVIALVTVLRNAGFAGSTGETVMKNMKIRMFTPAVQGYLKQGGISVNDQNGKMKTTIQLLNDINVAMKKHGIKPGSSQEGTIMYYLFGMRGQAGATKLRNAMAELADEQNRIANKSVGVAKAGAAKMQEFSTQAKFLDLLGAVTEKVFKVFEAFNAKGQSGVQGLITTINNFNVQPLIGMLSATGTVLGALYKAFSPFLPLLPYIVVGFTAFKVVTGAIAIWPLVSGIIATVSAITRLFTVLEIAKVAWLVLNAAFVATPIGLIVTGVTAAIVALYYLEKKFHVLTNTFKFFKDVFLAVIEAGKGFFSAIGAVFTAPSPTYEFNAGSGTTAPNQREASRSGGRFDGLLTIAGAPTGSTFDNKSPSAAPGLSVQMLGANP